MEHKLSRKIINNWYYIAVYVGAIFGLIGLLGDWDLRMRTLLTGTMFIHLHFFEEFGYPGGFPWVGMKVELKSVDDNPENWALNRISSLFGNEWFAVFVYILPMFLKDVKFLTLAAVIFTFAELLMHLLYFPLSLKKLYNPGLFTVLVGLLPTSIYYFTQIWGQHLYSWTDALLALVWIILHYCIAFRSPLYKKLGAKKEYAFSKEEVDRARPYMKK